MKAQFHFSIVTCLVSALAMGLCGCGKKEVAVIPDSPSTETTSIPTQKSASPDAWIAMESLAPGKWTAIEGAANIEWDQAGRILRIGATKELNGLRWAGPVPVTPYVVELEARRMSGSDFFCGLTFPVRDGSSSVSLIIGGWGGKLVGISSINSMDASENSTASQQDFEDGRWYRIRVEVRQEHLQAWIDDQQVIDAYTEDQPLSLRPGPIEACAPLGLATWMTQAELRGIQWRKLIE